VLRENKQGAWYLVSRDATTNDEVWYLRDKNSLWLAPSQNAVSLSDAMEGCSRTRVGQKYEWLKDIDWRLPGFGELYEAYSRHIPSVGAADDQGTGQNYWTLSSAYAMKPSVSTAASFNFEDIVMSLGRQLVFNPATQLHRGYDSSLLWRQAHIYSDGTCYSGESVSTRVVRQLNQKCFNGSGELGRAEFLQTIDEIFASGNRTLMFVPTPNDFALDAGVDAASYRCVGYLAD
jgi:hypothetical protein